jgi:hypothetical protein
MLHSVAVRIVGINFMVRYAIEVPGTKRVIKARRSGSVYEQVFVNVTMAQKRLGGAVA